MLKHCEAFKYSVKLGAVTDLFPCFLESTVGGDVSSVDGNFTGGGVNFSSETFEDGGLTGS